MPSTLKETPQIFTQLENVTATNKLNIFKILCFIIITIE